MGLRSSDEIDILVWLIFSFVFSPSALFDPLPCAFWAFSSTSYFAFDLVSRLCLLVSVLLRLVFCKVTKFGLTARGRWGCGWRGWHGSCGVSTVGRRGFHQTARLSFRGWSACWVPCCFAAGATSGGVVWVVVVAWWWWL